MPSFDKNRKQQNFELTIIHSARYMTVMTTTETELLQEIEAFCRKRGMSKTAFGKEACRNPAFVTHLSRGSSPTLRTVQTVRDYMRTAENG